MHGGEMCVGGGQHEAPPQASSPRAGHAFAPPALLTSRRQAPGGSGGGIAATSPAAAAKHALALRLIQVLWLQTPPGSCAFNSPSRAGTQPWGHALIPAAHQGEQRAKAAVRQAIRSVGCREQLGGQAGCIEVPEGVVGGCGLYMGAGGESS